MPFELPAFIDSGILYAALLFALIGTVFLYVNLGQQIQILRWAVNDQRLRIRELETRLGVSAGNAGDVAARPAKDSLKDGIVRLHGLGRSAEEIAREVGVRKAEVDFLLKVNEQLKSHGNSLALRKIS